MILVLAQMPMMLRVMPIGPLDQNLSLKNRTVVRQVRFIYLFIVRKNVVHTFSLVLDHFNQAVN